MQVAPVVAAPMVVSTIQATRQRRDHYMSKAVLGLSVTQITTGALCILLQIVLMGIKSPLNFVGQGFWIGVFFVLAGSFGIVSSKKKTACFIVAFLVLSIISAVMAMGMFLISPMDFGEISICHIRAIYSDNLNCASEHAVTGINAVMIIMAVIQVVMVIISSAVSCHGLCGGKHNQTVVVAGQVQYVQGPDGQQQMVILPFNQQGAGLAAGPSFNPVQPQLPGYNQTPPPTYESETKLPIPE